MGGTLVGMDYEQESLIEDLPRRIVEAAWEADGGCSHCASAVVASFIDGLNDEMTAAIREEWRNESDLATPDKALDSAIAFRA